MPKDLKVSLLLDVYGELLSEKQRLLIECYYNEDLSLMEISENEGITRQGARDAIVKAVSKLYNFEEKLHLLEIKTNLKQLKDDKLTAYIENL